MTVRTPWYRYKTRRNWRPAAGRGCPGAVQRGPGRPGVRLPISSPVNASGTPYPESQSQSRWTGPQSRRPGPRRPIRSGRRPQPHVRVRGRRTSNVMQGDWTPIRMPPRGRPVHSAGTVDAGEFAWDYVNRAATKSRNRECGPTYSLNCTRMRAAGHPGIQRNRESFALALRI